MNAKRRSFLKISSLLAGTAVLNNPLESIAGINRKINTFESGNLKVSIFHTNNLHGEIEASFKSFGGLKNVAHKLNEQENSGLLLDAGNFLSKNSTFSSRLNMISSMNKTGYHAVTPGVNEMISGEEELAQLASYMEFDLVNCNYNFQNAYLKQRVKPFTIIHSGKFKIGITGVGKPVKGINCSDPFVAANRMASYLKLNEKCDLVICLSQLGFNQKTKTPDNKELAETSKHIDLIISSDLVKASAEQRILKNKSFEDVILSQSVQNGLLVGKTEFYFDAEKNKNRFDTMQMIPGQKRDTRFIDAYQEVVQSKLA
uniref:hypothetical protein n=1 Tax=Pedobacter schmidteae TaxID=2201271 RepID=UPI000EB44C93|nr:hypothetical protein [Pedobacter schmidteae]